MKSMPRYDVTPMEQALIDKIPEAVATGDAEHIATVLINLYADPENNDYLSALMIIEKYLFRTYELMYFVQRRIDNLAYDEYFFDELEHKRILDAAMAKLDAEAARNCLVQAHEKLREGDLDGAYDLYTRSSLWGNVDGAYNHGVCLANGEGCSTDPHLAAFWYWFAAVRGNMKAMTNLAFCFRYGQGVCADEMTMLYWYIQAYLHGNEEAGYTVGSLLCRGQGLPNSQSTGNTILVSLNQGNTYFARTVLITLASQLSPYIYNK